MLGDFTKGRYRALELIADHIKQPSRELRLDAIICDITDEDLRWVTERLYHYFLKLLEDADCDQTEEEDDLIFD